MLSQRELTPEQKKCIVDAVEKARKDSPALAKYLDDVESVRKVYQGKVKKCLELEHPHEQR